MAKGREGRSGNLPVRTFGREPRSDGFPPPFSAHVSHPVGCFILWRAVGLTVSFVLADAAVSRSEADGFPGIMMVPDVSFSRDRCG